MGGRCQDPIIGFPRESGGERRTILTPAVARALIRAEFRVLAEAGIGGGVFISDEAYVAAGAELVASHVAWSAPLVLRYKSSIPADLKRLHAGQNVAALFHAEGDVALLAALKATGATAWSYEFVEEGDRFPLGRPGGKIAGIQAVLAGAQALQAPTGRGLLLARVAGADVPNALIIGCGNVGAAAADTAAALGAEVTVLVRSAASRADYLRIAPPNVQVLVNTRSALRKCLRQADLVIGAILVSTYDTQAMISEQDLGLMRPGAVIVDATCGYGSGYLPTCGAVQHPGDPPRVVRGIFHVKIDTLPALVPVTATDAYTNNAAPYLVRLAHVTLAGGDDQAIEAARIVHAGHLVHPVLIQHAQMYGMRP